MLSTSISSSGRQTIIQRSEVVMKNANPTWQVCDLSLFSLYSFLFSCIHSLFQRVELQADVCGGLDGPITIDCYEAHPTNKHELVGTCSVTLREISYYYLLYLYVSFKTKLLL